MRLRISQPGLGLYPTILPAPPTPIPPVLGPFVPVDLSKPRGAPSRLFNLSFSQNNAPYFPAVNPTTQRFFPGFYGVFDYSGGVNSNRFTNGDSGIINGFSTNSSLGVAPDNLQGIAFIMNWRALDSGTSSPNYQRSVIDLYANAIRAKNKLWWLWINWSSFVTSTSNSSVTTGSKCCPDWLISSNGVFNTLANYRRSDMAGQVPGAGVFPKLYNTPVLNAYLALITQIATWYKNDPNFMGIVHGIGSANASCNAVDNLGTQNPQVNYNTDYTDTGMINALLQILSTGRSSMPQCNFGLSCDYLFNMSGSSSYTGQDVQWTTILDQIKAQKGLLTSIDSWTNPWIYPQSPFSATGQNAYATKTNASYRRSLYSDEIYRGWRGPTPGVGNGYVGDILYGGSMELTEMGGYIGQFALSDIMSYRGASVDKAHYMFVDINYSQSGNYGTDPGNTPGAPKAPNTLWLGTTSYDATYGPSVYRYIQSYGPLNQNYPY